MAIIKLNLRAKLRIGVGGIVCMILLLLFFVNNLNVKLDEVQLSRGESLQQINQIKKIALSTKDYLQNIVSYDNLKAGFNDQNDLHTNAEVDEILDNIIDEVDKYEELKQSNEEIEIQVWDLTEKSTAASDGYIKQVSQKLASDEQRANVSTLERLVIIGALINSTTNHNIRVLFKDLKEDLNNKEILISFLNTSIDNATIDVKRLANTPFAQLPINAKKANERIFELVMEYIKNTEEAKVIANVIFQSTDHIFKTIEKQDAQSALSVFEDIQQRVRLVFLFLLTISIILIIINASLLRRVGEMMRGFISTFSDLSQGRFNLEALKNIRKKGDEIDAMSFSLNEMVENIRQSISTIKESALLVADISEEVTNTAGQISTGASEQASALQEISSTMEEIVSNIHQSSQNSKETESISDQAAGGVSEVETAAKESLVSVKQIAGKIAIINEIAFQTNLLALNAAVEAARAGEFGKGFAVVAAEVRKLAESSKFAADEIVVLSENSVKLTENADELMEEILPKILKTSSLVKEIAAASLEQNSGAEQVNSAITQINTSTQQNASIAEEMEATALKLKEKAETLKLALNYFSF